ncbi:MAG: hypothetical protein ACRCSN_03730 [Dermatophilaceae bacterium]
MTEPFDDFRNPTLLDVAETIDATDEEWLVSIEQVLGRSKPLLAILPSDSAGDQPWYEYCLRTLAKRRGVSDESPTAEISMLFIDMAVVAAITQQFHLSVDGLGDYDDDWQYLPWSNLAGPELLDLVAIGRAAERAGIDTVGTLSEPEQVGIILDDYIGGAWSRVFRELVDHLTESGLFVGLWGARHGETHPLSDDAWAIVNTPTADVMVGYEWITNRGYR